MEHAVPSSADEVRPAQVKPNFMQFKWRLFCAPASYMLDVVNA